MGIRGDFQAIHVSLPEVYIIFQSPREDPPYRARFAPTAQPHHGPLIATPLRRRRRGGEEQTRRHRGVRATFRGRVQGPGGARAFAGQNAEVVAAELHDGLNHFLGVELKLLKLAKRSQWIQDHLEWEKGD